MLEKSRYKLSQYTWALAYGKYDSNIIKEGRLKKGELHYVKNPYDKKWFADPFILDDSDNQLTLLVEEFDSGINKGRIARIIIDKRTDAITECSIILERPTHLSFPAIYRFDNKIYVHPENSASGCSFIYEYDSENDKLINPIKLSNKPLTDAIIQSVDNKFYMYATEYPDACGNRLLVLQSDSFLGSYDVVDTIVFPNKTARMAGAFISYNGAFLRPAQDCNHDYGEAVVFYDGTSFFSELRPKGYKYEGLHTFNHYKDSFVIDLKKYNYALIHNVLKRIMRIFF